MTTLEIIEKAGFCVQDKICVFCSSALDRWEMFCHSCQEYKGVMNVTDAVDYYGEEILGL
jgi:hypothetical protein